MDKQLSGFSTSGLAGNLRDESGLEGHALGIAFPTTKRELSEVLAAAQAAKSPVTIQGARTGICAGAVPQGGYVVNLSKYCAIERFFFAPTAEGAIKAASIRVQAGVSFAQIEQLLRAKRPAVFADAESAKNWEAYRQWPGRLYFAHSPSEETASVGGAVASAAVGSGILNGSLPGSVLALTVAFPSGATVEIEQGTTLAALCQAQGLAAPPQDATENAIALVCGAEGAAGILCSLTLALTPKPGVLQGLWCYHRSYAEMETFAQALQQQALALPGAQILAADWFAPACWLLLEEKKDVLPKTNRLPTPPPGAIALWIELAATDEEQLQTLLFFALEHLEEGDNFADDALAVEGANFEALKGTRHLFTEAANLFHSGELPLVLDYIAPAGQQAQAAQLAAQTLAQSQRPHSLMGHACVGHINVRLPAAGQETACLAQELTDKLATLGCTYSTEHGTGRAKVALLQQLNPQRAAQLRRLRVLFQ